MSLSESLQEFRSGFLPRQQLLSRIDQELAAHRVTPEALLRQLDEEHTNAPLPQELYGELVKRISRLIEEPTMIGPGSAASTDPTVLKVRDERTELFVAPRSADGPMPGIEVPTQRAPVRAGSILLGRFKLMELVGVGGMSRVYKAIDLRKVEAGSRDPYLAVKVLTIGCSDYFTSIVLQREAHKLQSLTHPNIVRVIDCDRDGQTVFMTMEYLDGVSLKAKILEPTFVGLPPHEALPMLEGIARGLSFAHQKGIVHGDLKPGNVILTKGGEVKVIDFGIARVVAKPKDDTDREEREQPHALTLPYASPEMIESQEPDPRDDVYALACIAHEVLTGVHPFARKSATAARDAGLKAVHHSRLTRRQFKAILGGLEFDREKRTPTVAQFMEEFLAPDRRMARRVTIAASIVAAAALALGIGRMLWFERPTQAPVPAIGAVFRDCATCPLMKVVPAGSFKQGSAAQSGLHFERPQHDVQIGAPFAIGLHEVTVGEFNDFIAATQRVMNGCEAYDGDWRLHAEVSWRAATPGQMTVHPVTCVSWDDASAYVTWLSQQTGQSYRLPSASEWEYAARAGNTAAHPWTDDAGACQQSNFADRSAAERYPGWAVASCTDKFVHAAPVGSFAPNAFGLHDTLGNVFEWVDDCWYDTYEGAPTDGSSRQRTACEEHEARGGSWFTPPQFVRLSYRNRFATGYRATSVGFRVVRDLHP